jgi:ABC-type amino acid transport substrate-binding protein
MASKASRRKIMRLILFALGLWLIANGVSAENVASTAVDAPQPVMVGGYVFPPFSDQNPKGEWSGLIIDLIALLNVSQKEYRFEFMPTAATRRYHDFANGRFDLMFFESPHWGWQDKPIVSLRGPVIGGEVFIAAAKPGRGQEYFADHKGKRIALFSGYHYRFAGFKRDKQYLRREHNAIITFSQDSSLQMVLRGRVELAVIPEAYLASYLKAFPQYRSQLLIADEPDQYYEHLLIKREGSYPPLRYLSVLIERLQDEGELQKLFVRHGLSVSTAN